jgi:putative selenium metabolism hydrolase
MADWNAVSLTQALVRVPGLSGNEGRVADLVEAAMHDLGYRDVGRDAFGSVVGYAGPQQDATALLFDSHIDVVSATGTWSHDPFGAVIAGGRLYGRGATDMKGPLAAALVGVAQAACSGRLDRQVAVSASVLEETIEGVALAAVLDRTRAEAVVICEPSSLAIKLGQRGRLEILVEVAGVPAHAAHPERGRNPILLTAAALAAIADMALPVHPEMGEAIMVPTDLTSEPYPSISSIPPLVRIRFDRRTVAGETAASVLDALRARLAELDPSAFRVRLSDAPVIAYTGHEVRAERDLPAWLGRRNSPLAVAAAASLAACGCPVRLGVYAFCTNGSESAGRRGLPTIGLGPGAEADAHTIDESVSVAELDRAVATYAELTRRIAGTPG